MDFDRLVMDQSLEKHPVGLGGCKNHEQSLPCCEYNITVFDNKKDNDLVLNFNGEVIKLQHGSLQEKNPELLLQYHGLKIISDEQWNLRIFQNTIKEKFESISRTCIKNCLIDARFCLTKSEMSGTNNPFAPFWLICSAYYLADAMILKNRKRPSPVHMLGQIRKFEKNKINENFGVVNDCLGIERSTPSLLLRMCKSTMGFSDMVERSGQSKIIQRKHDFLVKNSLLTDCYFYLGYINRNNIIKIKDSLSKKPELIHILKVAFDSDQDFAKIERQRNQLRASSDTLLLLLNQ